MKTQRLFHDYQNEMFFLTSFGFFFLFCFLITELLQALSFWFKSHRQAHCRMGKILLALLFWLHLAQREVQSPKLPLCS